jgi:hypothetical protein
MAVKTYSPKKVTVAVAGVPISGFSEGTFVTIEREVDGFTKKVGADGEVTRVQSANQSGKVTFTLQATSESNRYLMGLAKADEATLNGVVPITVKENIGNSLAVANNAWIMKIPNMEYGDDLSSVEWVFESEEIEILHNGSPGFGFPALPI